MKIPCVLGAVTATQGESTCEVCVRPWIHTLHQKKQTRLVMKVVSNDYSELCFARVCLFGSYCELSLATITQMFVCLGLTCFSISSFVGNVSDCIKKCLLGFVSIEFEFCSGVICELNHCHLETHEIKQQGEDQKQTVKAKYILFQNLCTHSLCTAWPLTFKTSMPFSAGKTGCAKEILCLDIK